MPIIADYDAFATVNYDTSLCHYLYMDIKRDFSLRFQRAAKEYWNTDKPKQSDMAKAFGVSQATVSDWWNGVKVPGLEKLIEICLRLDVCLEWLGTGRGPEKPPCHVETKPTLTQEQKEILRKITELVCD